ncbi:hypothetical protein EBZ39_03045 [bacterium]|nr:hypothetical protein [bacterium]
MARFFGVELNGKRESTVTNKHSEAGLGMAWRGAARPGITRQGFFMPPTKQHGSAGPGMALHGEATQRNARIFF